MAVRKVGSCRILREVGRGGMGVIYEAYQDGLDRRVAVKALDAGKSGSADRVERFRREGRAYAQIRHEAIPIVHDLVLKDDVLYLVTEFVDGADLHHVLASGGRLPAECVAALGARLADALDCVHAHALLHRDVKPANVMLSVRGDVKLMDFGIAKGKARPIPIREVVPGFPRRLARAIERCLERRPSRRWETAGALAAELEACAAGLLGGARPRERLASLMLERGLGDVDGMAAIAGEEEPGVAVTRREEPDGSARPSNRRIAWGFAAAMALAGLYAWLIRP